MKSTDIGSEHQPVHLATHPTPLVSVLIVTRNREQPLMRCVESILDSTYRNFEIVILDNGTPDSSTRIGSFLAALATTVPIRHIHVKPTGFAALRQKGVQSTQGEIVVSIDDDCRIGKENLGAIVALFTADPTIGIIGGNITNVGFGAEEMFKGRGKIGVNGQYVPIEDPSKADVFGSANMSFRRSAFEKVGGYDLYFAGGLEEADLTLSIRRLGYRVVYAPSIHVTHHHVPNRYRIRNRNIQMLRIYLFLKHFRPTSTSEWVLFLKNEAGLVGEDFGRAIKTYKNSLTPNFVSIVRKTLRLMFTCWQITLARIAIPYLLIRADRTRVRSEINSAGWN